MNCEDAWHLQDEITAMVNALGYSIWELSLDERSGCFTLQLQQHLDEAAASALCCHMPLPADYDGQGPYGSIFTLTP